jgi:hypothetical protein
VVRLHYRAMFGETKSLTMVRQDGGRGDTGLYAASIPSADFPAFGQMVRYVVTASSGGGGGGGGGGGEARKPKRDTDAYGAVVDAAAAAAESTLPTLHLFTQNTGGMLMDDPVACDVAFANGGDRLKFYGGGVTVRRRGSGRRDPANMWGKSGTKDWPKRKLKLDFRGRDFKVSWGGGGGGGGTGTGTEAAVSKVEEMNLHSSYDEPGPESYLREVLAAAAFERAGVAAPAARHVVLRLNGDFYGLYVMVENVDESFLERHGLDPRGPLFKAVHWKYSNLRPAAAPWMPCPHAPDWESSWGPCPEVYRYSGDKDAEGVEGAALGALGGLIGALDAVNRGGDFTQLWRNVNVDAVAGRCRLTLSNPR